MKTTAFISNDDLLKEARQIKDIVSISGKAKRANTLRKLRTMDLGIISYLSRKIDGLNPS